MSHNAEVVTLASDLLRIDTSNPGPGEKDAAEYVCAALREAGIEPLWLEPAPGRVSLVARVAGRDRELAPLLVHTHLDVVPAVAGEWSVDPFSGVIKDGYVWGRGAVDMKGMVAAVLAAVRALQRAGTRPRRDIVLAFFADEEAGGELGAGHVTRTRPDLFADCEDAIGEVGGFSYTFGSGQRCYLVSSAEKGVFWARLKGSGQAGHGSMMNPDNAVAAVCGAITRMASHPFTGEPTATVMMFLERAADILGLPLEPVDGLLAGLGPIARVVRASMQDTVNPTTLSAGYKVNVVPSTATASIDGRFLPGHEQVFTHALRDLAGEKVQIEPIFSGDAVESPWDVPLVAAIERALRHEDPTAEVLPYMGTAFTDAKWLSQLGIRCYGFCPLKLPPELDFTALFHGVDERVPVSALTFSVDVLRHLFNDY